MTQDVGGLAATGSNVTPWLIVAGIIVLLGVIALVIAGVVRSRRSERQVESAAGAVADAGGTLPVPDSNAPASDETVIQEAADLRRAEPPSAAPDARGPFAGDPAEIDPSPEFAPNAGPMGENLNEPADTSWPADGKAYPHEQRPDEPRNPQKDVPPFDPPREGDDTSK